MTKPVSFFACTRQLSSLDDMQHCLAKVNDIDITRSDFDFKVNKILLVYFDLINITLHKKNQ